MPWFRFYNTFLNDPKVQQLRPDQFKTYVNLLVVANMGEERGVISADDVDDLAFTLRMDGDPMRAHLSELIQRGLLIEVEGGLKPRDWDKQQFASDNSTARVQRHRQRHREQGETFPERFGNVRETDAESEGHTESETEADAERDGEGEREETQSRNVPRAFRPGTTTPALSPHLVSGSVFDGFQVTDAMLQWAVGCGVPADQVFPETESFLDWHRAKGVVPADVTAAWRKWIRQSPRFAAKDGRYQREPDGIHGSGPFGQWTPADFAAKARRLQAEEDAAERAAGREPKPREPGLFDEMYPEKPAPRTVDDNVIEVPVKQRERGDRAPEASRPARDISSIVRIFKHHGCPLSEDQQARLKAGAEPHEVLTGDQREAWEARRAS